MTSRRFARSPTRSPNALLPRNHLLCDASRPLQERAWRFTKCICGLLRRAKMGGGCAAHARVRMPVFRFLPVSCSHHKGASPERLAHECEGVWGVVWCESKSAISVACPTVPSLPRVRLRLHRLCFCVSILCTPSLSRMYTHHECRHSCKLKKNEQPQK